MGRKLEAYKHTYTSYLQDGDLIGSWPSDHYFHSSVGLSVCLFVCAVFLSRL